MQHHIRRYQFRITPGEVEVIAQAQTARGTYFRAGSLVVKKEGKTRIELEDAVLVAVESLTPVRLPQVQ